jgi:Protein of unknown function (DUF3168)
MAAIEEALFAILAADGTVKGLLANPDGSVRIYPELMPEETPYPALSYFRVSGARFPAYDGSILLAHPRFQFDVWANDSLSARQVAGAVRQALQGYKGTAAGVVIAGAFIRDEHSAYEHETRSFRHAVDFEVFHQE